MTKIKERKIGNVEQAVRSALEQLDSKRFEKKYKKELKRLQKLHDINPELIEIIHDIRCLGYFKESEAIISIFLKRKSNENNNSTNDSK